MVSVTLIGVGGPTAAQAQTDLSVEVGASQLGPPAGLEGEDARFGIAGLRFAHFGAEGSGVSASLMLGRTFRDTTNGDFVSGVLTASLRSQWSAGWSGGMDLEILGFQVRDPFPYRAFAVEAGPRVGVQSGPVSVTASGVFGIGRSTVELWRVPTGIHRTFEDALWRVGGVGEALLGMGTLRVGASGSAYTTAGGGYSSVGGTLILAGAWGATELRADAWQTPLGSEVTGGVAFVIPLSGWSVRGFLGKSDPDPLTLAEPGSGSGGILIGRSLYSSERPTATSEASAYDVLSVRDGSALVRIVVNAPQGARSVALLGDFTLWDPLPMVRESGRWAVEFEVPLGIHHYGFLVDDAWYVPDDTRDVVPDEWGRLSAVLVIEGAS